MVLVLKKGASKREILQIERQLKSHKLFDLSKFCGKVKLKREPLDFQKEIRDEWMNTALSTRMDCNL